MRFSIVTVCYNSVQTIKQTIKSVLVQTCSNIEYIIIDGGSTDGTLDILEKYKKNISVVVSEPDSGIYDAMNKGIKLATGDVIGILNSDDIYTDKTVLADIMNVFWQESIDACYGDIVYVDRENTEKIVRQWKAGEYKESKLQRGWIPPHPAFFVRKELYQKYGCFDSRFKIAADYEIMLRFFKKYSIVPYYLKKNIVHMREGGHSAKSMMQRTKGWKEIMNAWKVNDLQPPSLLILRRILSKINQYL